jgi:hypothetical protein
MSKAKIEASLKSVKALRSASGVAELVRLLG